MDNIEFSTQVDRSHYDFKKYVSKKRWSSYWHQLDEILKRHPDSVLEIGSGIGQLKALLRLFDVKCETVDIDPELHPDIVASALDLPADDNSYDIGCAFQVLEHFEFEDSLRAFSELVRVSRNHVIISLPDKRRQWPFAFYIPKIGAKEILVRVPHRPRRHEFDGQHYWELGAKGYLEREVLGELMQVGGLVLESSFSVPRNPYHRFFVFRKYAARES